MQTVLNGILEEQQVWNQNVTGGQEAQQEEQQLQKKQKKRPSWQQNYEDAWRVLFDFSGLTDEHIKMIIDHVCSDAADTARAAVIKIYTYETDLYPSLNAALQTKDKSKIMTLGPYAYLLYMSLRFGKFNSKLTRINNEQLEHKQFQELKEIGFDSDEKFVRVYRGLSLPPKAIQFYQNK